MSKFCKDCRWYLCPTADPLYAQCLADANMKMDLVTGEAEPRRKYCSTQRMSGWIAARIENECGLEGRWWEPNQ